MTYLKYFDIIQIILFLGFTFFIVFKLSLQKISNFRYYAVGDGKFQVSDLVYTIVATWASGAALFFILEQTYADGLYFILPHLGLPLSLYLSSHLIMRMHQFNDKLSIAEAIGSIYGDNIRIITAILGIISKVGSITIQFKVMAISFSIILNLDPTISTIISGSIVILYTVLGGIKAVVITDIYQFVVFSLLLALLGLVIFHQMPNNESMISFLATHPCFNFQQVLSNPNKLFSALTFFCYFVMPGVYAPEIFQRVAIARSVEDAKKAFKYSSGIFLLMILVLFWLGIIILNTNSNLSQEQVIPFLVSHYLPIGLKGCFMVCILAFSMSTADSYLNNNAVLFTNDIYNLFKRDYKNPILTARVFTLLEGILCLFLAFWKTDLLSLILIFDGFYISVAAIPILLTFLGFRTHKKVIITSMALAAITNLGWKFFYGSDTSIFPSLFVNIFTFFATHYLFQFEGGWMKFAPNTPLGQLRTDRRLEKFAKQQEKKQFNWYRFLYSNTPKTIDFYFYFGLYVGISDYLILYTMDYTSNNPFLIPLYLVTGIVGLIMSTCFTCPLWASKLGSENKKTLICFWMTILFLNLFANTMILVLSGFQSIQLYTLILNVLLLGYVLDLSLLLTFFFFNAFLIISSFSYLYHISLPFVYLFNNILQSFSTVIILLLFFKQLWRYKAEEKENGEMIGTLTIEMNQMIHEMFQDHDKRLAMFLTYYQTESLKSYFNWYMKEEERLQCMINEINLSNTHLSEAQILKRKKALLEQQKELQKQIATVEDKLTKITDKISDIVDFRIDLTLVDELLAKLQKQIIALGRFRMKINSYTNHLKLMCDAEKIKGLLSSTAMFLSHCLKKRDKLMLFVQDTQLRYKNTLVPAISFSFSTNKDLSSEIKPEYIPKIAEKMLFVTTNIEAKNALRIKNQEVIQKHNGYYDLSFKEKRIQIQYILPVSQDKTKDTNMKCKK